MKELDKVVKLINNRPRKRLNYLTPVEVFKSRKVVEIGGGELKKPLTFPLINSPKNNKLGWAQNLKWQI